MQGGSKNCGGTGQETEKAVKGVSITGRYLLRETGIHAIAYIATIPESLGAVRRRSVIRKRSERGLSTRGIN